MIRALERQRFSVALVVGIIIIAISYSLQIALPISHLLFLPDWLYYVWLMFGGFVGGLVVGALVRDWLKGIFGALVSIFLGHMIATIFLWSAAGALNFVIGALGWGIVMSLYACVPAVVGSVFGTLIMKEIIKRARTL